MPTGYPRQNRRQLGHHLLQSSSSSSKMGDKHHGHNAVVVANRVNAGTHVTVRKTTPLSDELINSELAIRTNFALCHTQYDHRHLNVCRDWLKSSATSILISTSMLQTTAATAPQAPTASTTWTWRMKWTIFGSHKRVARTLHHGSGNVTSLLTQTCIMNAFLFVSLCLSAPFVIYVVVFAS